MKHLIPCEELKQQVGGKYQFLACQYDDGRFVKNSEHTLRLGIGTDAVIIFMCEGCADSFRAYFTTEALETIAQAIKRKDKPDSISGTFMYRGLTFGVREGYILSGNAADELRIKMREAIDAYLDKGEPLALNGLVLQKQEGEES